MIHNLATRREGFTSNVFLVTGERTALVDVGNEFDVVDAVRDGIGDSIDVDDHDSLDAVVLTHTHYDHVANLDDIVEFFDVDVVAYDEEFPGVDASLDDEETIQLGDHEYVALHTPGHKDDHLCLYAADPGILFAGDLVFAGGSFGRTDLDEGHRPTLIESIERVRDVTAENVAEMHTGHGESVDDDPRHHIEMALQAARF